MKLKKTIISTFILIVCLLFTTSIIEAGNKKTIFSLNDWMAKDEDFKHQIIQAYIKAAKEDHVIIRLPVEYYKKEIESLIQNSIKNGDAAGLDNSFGVTIKTIAIMDGDWDNGKNKLETAKTFMGPATFDDFKKRHPEKYKKLEQDSKGQQ